MKHCKPKSLKNVKSQMNGRKASATRRNDDRDLRGKLEWIWGDKAAHIRIPELPQTLLETVVMKNLEPKLFIRSDGLFVIRQDDETEEEVEGHFSTRGLRYVKVNDFMYWAHDQVYKAFIGQKPVDYKIIPIDGDLSNCHVSNLALAPAWLFET